MSLKRGALAAGAAIFVGHVIAANLIIAADDGGALRVRLDSNDPLASTIIDGNRSRVVVRVDGRPSADISVPGMRYITWSEHYRGGFTRAVGAAHVVGRRQAPSDLPCTVRIRVGQRLLDAGPGSVAHLVRELLDKELRGFSTWPVGSFDRIGSLSLEWAEGGSITAPREVLGATVAAPPRGFIALHAELVFTKAKLPIFVALVPKLEDGKLTMRALASAKVVANNRIYRFVLDILDGDRRATDATQAELGRAIIELLEPPPPLALPGGGQLRLTYCHDTPLAFRARAYGELPLAVVLENKRGDIQPLELEVGERLMPESIDSAIEIEIDANGLGALLQQLWASGFLDRALVEADLTGTFNRSPEVVRLLSVRARDLELVGPPILELRDDGGYDIGAELGVTIIDGEMQTPARLFARGHLAVGDRVGESEGDLLSLVRLDDVGLTCRPTGDQLAACYSTLVGELARRAPDASSMIAEWLQRSFKDLLGDRAIAVDGVPGRVELRAGRVRASKGRLLIEFDSSLVGSVSSE